jgi:hypothetical protein
MRSIYIAHLSSKRKSLTNNREGFLSKRELSESRKVCEDVLVDWLLEYMDPEGSSECSKKK